MACDFEPNDSRIETLGSCIEEPIRRIYDEGQYRKSQEYLRVNTQFGWITHTFSVMVILAFWFAGGFPVLDLWARSLNQGPVATGQIYMGILVFSRTLLFLPSGIYDTLSPIPGMCFSTIPTRRFLRG